MSDHQKTLLVRALDDPNLDHHDKICTEFCFDHIFKKNHIPIYSKENKMYIEKIPPILASLNQFERMLIQKGRCFQTIVQLNTKKNCPGFKGLSALKGVSMHFPLNFEETNTYVQNTIHN